VVRQEIPARARHVAAWFRPDFGGAQRQDMYEIKSSLILQPGPAALTDGLAELQRIIERWAKT
jgi:iron complex transport system substrate-binding protein